MSAFWFQTRQQLKVIKINFSQLETISRTRRVLSNCNKSPQMVHIYDATNQ